MRLETIKTVDIFPYKNNPRKNDGAVAAVVESIRQCSYIGHTRYKALKAMGYEEIQCLICEGLTEEQKKKYRFLDNRTGEKAAWDLLKLETELEGLDLEGFDFFGMAEDLTAGDAPKKELQGSTEFETEVFGDEKFRYECPKCGFKFN